MTLRPAGRTTPTTIPLAARCLSTRNRISFAISVSEGGRADEAAAVPVSVVTRGKVLRVLVNHRRVNLVGEETCKSRSPFWVFLGGFYADHLFPPPQLRPGFVSKGSGDRRDCPRREHMRLRKSCPSSPALTPPAYIPRSRRSADAAKVGARGPCLDDLPGRPARRGCLRLVS